ncbi:class I SAM-dependent methyltransferase [Aequorivita todarodis]|uniref:class I SAM-dependent methyltransferase n=1 Tax=Aequorivita todarodis TaxID=2036821 RepID=UPI0023500E47|nr:class I SAM-dependent methyltransferase [Aequorivita todarodis]MDC8000595.1 class I SAM-dependent methyltransferase [Aequorivita todarodis]
MTCKVCQKEINPRLLLKNKGDFGDIYRCPKCQITFVSPQPSDEVLNEYYNGMYLDLTVSFDEKKMKWAQRSMRGYLKVLKKLNVEPTAEITFLDLGGGLGYYRKAAAENNLHSILVEKDPISVQFAKKHLKLENIIEKDLTEFFSSNDEQYDIVFFRHVIEHVKDPSTIIQGISNLLKTNGILIIETDNNAGIELLIKDGVRKFYLDLYKKSFNNVSFLKLLIKRPFAVDPPRHLFGFRMRNLSMLLTSQSLSSKVKIHYRLGHPIYWPNIPSTSAKQIIKSFLKLNLKAGFRLTISYLNLVFRKSLQLVGLSSGICIYAQKLSK